MLKAVIIDDEPRGRKLLQTMLTKMCKGIEVVGMGEDIPTGVAAVIRHQPDVVFLDIEMPRQNGFELFKYFNPITFDVIFTTAYDQYAVKAFKFSALDYLLKPIDLEELRAAIEKVRSKHQGEESKDNVKLLQESLSQKSFDKIALPTTDGFFFTPLDHIIRCEADGNYTIFYLTQKRKAIVSRTLKEYDKLLTESGFFRIHRSHLINLKHIEKYTRAKAPYVTMIDGAVLVISSSKKEEFLKRIVT